jgi:lysylphosphatidylglycerol synthetase-like protein (DUF2156 family)
MSDLAQAALISGSIFVVVMATTYGRRAFSTHALLRPLIMVGVFGFIYLRAMPLDNTAELAAYGVAVVLGLVFAAAATLATRVERERDGGIFTVTGPAFLVVWALAMLARLAFIWSVENVDWARDHFGRFMIEHQISLDAIAPFFVIWALVMVLSRVAVVWGRANALSRPAATAREPELV